MRRRHGWARAAVWRLLAGLFAGLFLVVAGAGPAMARAPFSCAGAALDGGTELLCSHTDPDAPTQVCSFSWYLMGEASRPSMVTGSFSLPRRVANLVVFQGSGYAYALSTPVVLCQRRKDAG